MKSFSVLTGLVMAVGLAAPALAQSTSGGAFPAPGGTAPTPTATAAEPAGNVILASNPQSLINFFFEQGIPAQLTTDSVGDPLVEFRVDGDTGQVFFYDCTDNTNCLALQFYSGYKLDAPVSLETINSWNTDRRFVRAYRTDDGAARIEMDIATSRDGVSSRDFADLYALWTESVKLFEERIGW